MSHGTPLSFIHVLPVPSNKPTMARAGRPAGIAPSAAAPAIEPLTFSYELDSSLGTPPQAPMTKQSPPSPMSVVFVYIVKPLFAARNEPSSPLNMRRYAQR